MKVIRQSRPATLLALLAAAVPLAGCATKGDLRNVTTELRALSARQDSLLLALERQSMVMQDSLRGTTSQLFEVRGTVNQQLARIQQEIQIIRQENAQFAQLLAGIRDQLERMARSGSMGSAAALPPAGGGGGLGTPPSNDLVDLFQTAVDQFERRQYTTARRAFDQVITRDPNGELAPEAMFKIGEIYLAEDRDSEALQTFQSIPSLYPQANKVPDALYQVALIHLEQGNRSEARRTLERVVETYPDAPITETARQRLREIPPGQ